MPIKSQSQWRYLWSNHPDIAQRWIDEYHTNYKDLPNKVGGCNTCMKGGCYSCGGGNCVFPLSPREQSIGEGINEDIDIVKNTATSFEDVYKLAESNTNVILYSDLNKYDNIQDILYPYNACIFLYLNKENYGHWCCVFKYPNQDGYECFDSYGIVPDDELKWTTDQFRLSNGQYWPQLTYLLWHQDEPVEYNNYKFQGKNSSTCGLWCALRLNNRDMSLEEFKYNFIDLPKKYNITPDDFLSYIFMKK